MYSSLIIPTGRWNNTDSALLHIGYKYADRDEAGEFKIDADNKINVSAENMQLFLKDLQDLLTQEVSVGELKLSQLGEKAMLSAEDLFKLDGLIKE